MLRDSNGLIAAALVENTTKEPAVRSRAIELVSLQIPRLRQLAVGTSPESTPLHCFGPFSAVMASPEPPLRAVGEIRKMILIRQSFDISFKQKMKA